MELGRMTAVLATETRREAVAELRQRLAGVLERNSSAAPPLATGLHMLDEVLPGGGIPRGRLTEFLGAPGAGRTTVVRQLAMCTAEAGLWVAYVDATRTLAPRDWVPHGMHDGVWIVRPPDAARGAWCADVLLRTGAFALVVLDGAPPLERGIAVRLTRLAREHDAALVVLGAAAAGSRLGGALRLRFERAEMHRGRREGRNTFTREWREQGSSHAAAVTRTVRIVVEKGGPRKIVEVNRAIPVARRLCTHPEIPDRRRPATGRGSSRAGSSQPARSPAGEHDNGTARLGPSRITAGRGRPHAVGRRAS